MFLILLSVKITFNVTNHFQTTRTQPIISIILTYIGGQKIGSQQGNEIEHGSMHSLTTAVQGLAQDLAPGFL